MKYPQLKCVLLDLDGTVYLGDKPICGAVEAVEKLKQKYKVLFLTNNSSLSCTSYAKKLGALGFAAKEEDIYTSGCAAAEFLVKERSSRRVFVLGTTALRESLKTSGVKVVNKNAEIVLVGYDTALTYKRLELACDFIRSGAEYFITHPDINCPKQNGYKPDVGSFIKLIEASTGRFPSEVFGKPSGALSRSVCSALKLNPNEIAMVGDRIATDLAFGVNNGHIAFAVLTGEATREEIIESGIKVDGIFPSIKELSVELTAD